MKRYRYVAIGMLAAMILTSCESLFSGLLPDNEATFQFGYTDVTTTQTSAQIEVDMPYITVDDEIVEAEYIYLQYAQCSSSGEMYDDIFEVHDYDTTEEETIIFYLDDLEPDTDYVAYIIMNGGEYGEEVSEPIYFTTGENGGDDAENIEVICDVDIVAQGVSATIEFYELYYFVDGESIDIESVTIEYAPDENYATWSTMMVDGHEINDYSLSVVIPEEMSQLLNEKSNYVAIITITPEGGYEPYSEEFTFTTRYAEVTAEIATPELLHIGEDISIEVATPTVYLDGRNTTDYTLRALYRMKGKAQWNECKLKKQSHGYVGVIASTQLIAATTYEVKVEVTASIQESSVDSPIATITTYEEAVEGDTSTIAGTWKLTSWRGAEPPVAVYLVIDNRGSVTLYQRIEGHTWGCYSSNATLLDGIISGTYSDGIAWGADYYVTTSQGSMTWVDTEDDADISVYERATLPADITSTRSTTTNTPRFL